MSSTGVIMSGGLATSANPLGGGGGNYTLENMVADLRGWATKRNGMKLLSPTSTWNSVFSLSATYQIRAAWCFDDHVFIYVDDGTNSGIAAFSMVTSAGWHKVVEQASVIRLDPNSQKPRVTSADRRLLIQTATGVKRIASIHADYYPTDSAVAVNYSAMYRDAGIPRALDPRCPSAVALGATYGGKIALAGYEWLSASSAVAYRIVWFKRDENGVPGIGMPSGRVVVRNTNAGTAYATRLKVNIPARCSDSSYVMQIYRTNVIAIDGASVIPDPGDEMFLAGEYRMTSTDLSNKYVLYEDVSFDGILGDALYTNETQEGALAGRMQPPVCHDVAYFGGCSFFANTTERQRLTMKLLAVDPTAAAKGLRVGDKIVAGDIVMEAVSVATAEDTQPWYFEIDATAGVGSEVIRCIKTAESFVYKYNIMSNTYNGRYYAYNLTTNNDIVGIVGFEEKSIGGSTGAYIGINRVDAPVQILPIPTFTSTPSNTLALACAVVTNVGPTTVTVTTSANHNLTTNDLVFLAPFAASTESGTSSPRCLNTDVPAGVYKVTVTGAATYTFPAPAGAASNQTDARAATTGGWSHKIFDTTTSIWTEARSANNSRINRLMWSSPFEPETAPIANSADVGAADKAILRIVPTQDSLFVFKEDGTWRLKGQAGDWEIIVLDASCVLAGAESPAVVDGRIFAYSTAGVVSVDDGGSNKVSGDVSGDLENLLRSVATSPNDSQKYVGCGHGESKSYWLSVPAYSTPLRSIYRYHTPTRTWSKHIIPPALESYASAIDNVGAMCTAKASRYTTFDKQAYAERLVIGCSSTSGANQPVLIERRSGTVIDYSDYETPSAPSSFDTVANTVTLASATGVEIGDMFIWYDPAFYIPGGYSFSPSVAARGLYRAKISAVNGNVITLDISGQVPALSTWPAVGAGSSGAILKQIRASIAPMPIMAKDGLSLLQFHEIVMATGSCGRFTTCQFGFNGEIATAAPGTFQATSQASGFAYADWRLLDFNMADQSLQYIRTFRTGVPRAVSTGPYLIVTIRNSAACENFDIAGIRVIYTEADNKTRRTNA